MRWRTLIGWLAVLAVVLIAVIFVLLSLFDVSAYRKRLESGTSSILGRQVIFEGAMSLSPSLWPTFEVEGAAIANPAWASRPYLLRAERFEIQVALLPLILGKFNIKRLAFEGADLLLETNPEGATNWILGEDSAEPMRFPDINAITVERSVVGLQPYGGQLISFAVDDASAVLAVGEPVSVELRGSYNEVPFALMLTGGTPAEFTSPTGPWPLEISLFTAGASLSINGTIARPAVWEGYELSFAVEGGRLSRLSPLIGASLPALGGYAFSGRLIETEQGFTVSGFTGHAGASDISGTINWVRSAPRPRLSVNLVSRRIQLQGLAAGADGRKGGLQRLVALDRPLPADGLKAVDASFRLDARQILSGQTVLGNASVAASLENGHLLVSPLGGTLFGTAVDGKLELNVLETMANITFRSQIGRVDLGQALRSLPTVSVDGTLEGLNIEFSSRGHTLRELLDRGRLQVTIRPVDLSIKDADSGKVTPIGISSAKVTSTPEQDLALGTEGVLRAVPFKLNAKGGRLIDLVAADTPWPLSLSVYALDTLLEVKGSMALPFDGAGVAADFILSGEQLNTLDALFDNALPDLGPYQLTGRFASSQDGYAFTDLQGRIGASNITGRLGIATGGPRPRIDLKLASTELHVKDVMESRDAAGPKKKRAGERVIPDTGIPVAMLRELDAEVQLNVSRIIADLAYLGEFSLAAKVANGRLVLLPFRATLSGGSIVGSLDLDAAGPTPTMKIDVTVQGLDYGTLLKSLEVTDLIEGTADIDIDLAGRGATLRDWLSQVNGKAEFVGGPGKIANRKLGLWGSDLMMMALPTQWRKGEFTTLNCIVSHFDVVDGIARSDAILIDTPRVTVAGAGVIDLNTEKLESQFRPKPKDPSLFTIATPMYYKGTLSEPKATTGTLSTAKTVGKLWIGLANPATLILFFGDTGTGKANPCAAAIDRREAAEAEEASAKRGIFKRAKDFFKKSSPANGDD